MCGRAGLLLALASSIFFLVVAAKNRSREAANCNGCALALSTLLAWVVIAGNMRGELRRQDEVQETTRMLVAVYELAHDVDSIRARLGRLPADQKEFVQLRGEPIPRLGVRSISYFRDSEPDYRLDFMLGGFWGDRRDLFGYVAWYSGPNANPRLHVDLF
jgi:hypothetical protein